MARDGADGEDAATALLLKRPPETGASLLSPGETAAEAAVRLASVLRRSYLPLQGPPGTGKTYSAAEQILELVTQGRAVGVTGPSHAVIEHLIDTVCRRASERGRTPRIGQKPDEDRQYLQQAADPMTAEQLECALRDGELDVAAGTAARGLTGFRVGTVDKFQGREAPVVIYSMATSSAEEAPRGLEFLYDRHRLNVATSRARAMAIIVASPDLIRVSCRTPHQMTLVNALCRAWEERG